MSSGGIHHHELRPNTRRDLIAVELHRSGPSFVHIEPGVSYPAATNL